MGIRDITTANLVVAAITLQNSLRFLCLAPVNNIRNAIIKDTRGASAGLIECITSPVIQPFNLLISLMSIVPWTLKTNMKIARPIAASAAAIAIANRAKTCPVIF